MKKFVKITGLVLGGLVLAVAAFVGYVAAVGVKTYDPPATPHIRVAHTPAAVKRGEAIGLMHCLPCHGNDEGRLTGRQLTDLPAMFGTFYSANITQDKETGIGKWTDGDLKYFLRTGVRPDGTFAGVMPKFPNMADADVEALIAWLRSDTPPAQATRRRAPKSEYSLFSKLLSHTVLKPEAYPLEPLRLPDSTDQVAFGRYVANDYAHCYSCHSADFTKQSAVHPEESAGFYGGGNQMVGEGGKPIFTANLTFDPETGIGGGKYTREQFVRAVKLGVRPDGTTLRPPMGPHPTLTDGEAGAIFEYLKTVPQLHNNIPQKEREALAKNE